MDRVPSNYGVVFDPETVALLRACLDDAWAHLSPIERSNTLKSTLALRILHAAAAGERDPIRLRTWAQKVFEPEDVNLMTTVYEDVLKAFSLIERTDPVTELIAKTVLEMVQTGERDPARLKELTIKAIEDIKR
jgi:hypothetical protein